MTTLNPGRTDVSEREALTVWVESLGWQRFLDHAEEAVIAPLRIRALTDPRLDPREQTGIVRALENIQALILLPYERLAAASGKQVQDLIPERVARLFR